MFGDSNFSLYLCTRNIKSSTRKGDSPTERAASAEVNSFTFCRVAKEEGQ